MAALAHHDEAGLNRVRLMDDLFRRMAQNHVGSSSMSFCLARSRNETKLFS